MKDLVFILAITLTVAAASFLKTENSLQNPATNAEQKYVSLNN